jgi:hypothetical protein
MPNARIAHAVRLEFAPASLVQANLSGAAFTGDWLWVAGDEACGLDRLRRLDPVGREVLRFGEVRDFPLADLLDLPGLAEEEADLEGMAFAAGFLWVVGSHGLKRKSTKPDRGWPLLAENRDPVRFEAALTESFSLPHGRGTNRAEAICDPPPALSGGKANWLVLYDAPGTDRMEGEHTVFGDLLRRD